MEKAQEHWFMSQESLILFILRNEMAKGLTADCSEVSHKTVEQGCGASGGKTAASEDTASVEQSKSLTVPTGKGPTRISSPAPTLRLHSKSLAGRALLSAVSPFCEI